MTDKTIDDGGLAFPGRKYQAVDMFIDPDGATRPTFADVEYPGMTLRDYFAGQAIGASLLMLDRADGDDFKRLAERRGIDWKKGGMSALAAALSYETADAMIAARKGGAA